jgi:5'-nucleotidase
MRSHARLSLFSVLLAVAALVVATGATSKTSPPIIQKGPELEIQLLALNDFHGNLLPPGGSSGRVGTVNAGGAEYLATHVRALEQANRNSYVVSAGDLIGASPLLSALFHDEPTIEAMNLIGLDLNAVGNHEFDEGTTELTRMQQGGCHPADGCLDGDGFAGADFKFLAANVVNAQTDQTLFPAYHIENFTGAKVAFIGMTLEGTPNIVSPSGVAGYDFLDEADTVNALIPELKKKTDAIVVLVHEGGSPTALDINGCSGVSGAIVDIVNRLDSEVDLVVSGHTHQPYVCELNDIPVTSAYSFGRLITDIDLRVNRATKDVTSVSINNRIVTRDVDPAEDITALIDRYNTFAAPIANRPIGHITADILRANDPDGSLEQPLGDVIADAQLDATDDAGFGDAVVSFMNPGGVRADLIYAGSPAGEGDGVVTYGELFTVQPFGNSLVTMTLTGAQIDRMLEEQFCGLNSPHNTPTPGFFKVLLPSAGFHYTWNSTIANSAGNLDCNTANAVSGIALNAVPLDPAANYRVTVNSFLADGGDGFAVLKQGTDRLGGAVDTDAFEAFLAAAEPTGISPPATDRIDVVS